MVTDLLRSRPAAAAAAAGWTKRSGALEEFVPRNANGGVATTSGVAWTWSAYTELTSGLANPFIPHVIHASTFFSLLVGGTFESVIEVEVATGAAGSEALLARFSDCCGAAVYAATIYGVNLCTSKSVPCAPNPIPAGTRIAFRVRCSLPDTQAVVSVSLYLGGYDTAAPSSYTEPNLDSYLNGDNAAQLLTTPLGSFLSITPASFPDYGSWVEILASAPSDLLVWGTTYTSPQISNQSRYIEFGTGPADSETSRARLAIPGGGRPANNGLQLMRRPLFVQSGERLAARASGVAVAMDHQFLYAEM